MKNNYRLLIIFFYIINKILDSVRERERERETEKKKWYGMYETNKSKRSKQKEIYYDMEFVKSLFI